MIHQKQKIINRNETLCLRVSVFIENSVFILHSTTLLLQAHDR
jgi:hypothetical protein